MDESKLRAAVQGLNWEARYRMSPAGARLDRAFLPELSRLDDDFAAALDKFKLRTGTLLEIGTGTGAQAIQFARRGFTVTATDVADTALGEARQRADERGVTVEFVRDNVLFSCLNRTFDVVVDRGCLAILPQEALGQYVATVSRLVDRQGTFLLKLDAKRLDRIELMRQQFDVVEDVPSWYQHDEAVSGQSVRIVAAHCLVLRPRRPSCGDRQLHGTMR